MKPIQTPERGMGMLGPVPAHLLDLKAQLVIASQQGRQSGVDTSHKMLRYPNVYCANKFSIQLFLIVLSFAFLWSSDAAVVLTCVTFATGAVGVDVAPHAPAGVSVADAFATTTFVI